MNLDELVDWCRARDLHVTIEPPMADFPAMAPRGPVAGHGGVVYVWNDPSVWTNWTLTGTSDSKIEGFPKIDVKAAAPTKAEAIEQFVREVEDAFGEDLERVEACALGQSGFATACLPLRALPGHAVGCTKALCAPHCPVPAPKGSP